MSDGEKKGKCCFPWIFCSPAYLYFYVAIVLTCFGLSFSILTFVRGENIIGIQTFLLIIAWWTKSPLIDFGLYNSKSHNSTTSLPLSSSNLDNISSDNYIFREVYLEPVTSELPIVSNSNLTNDDIQPPNLTKDTDTQTDNLTNKIDRQPPNLTKDTDIETHNPTNNDTQPPKPHISGKKLPMPPNLEKKLPVRRNSNSGLSNNIDNKTSKLNISEKTKQNIYPTKSNNSHLNSDANPDHIVIKISDDSNDSNDIPSINHQSLSLPQKNILSNTPETLQSVKTLLPVFNKNNK